MYANRIVKKKKQFVVNFTTHTLILEWTMFLNN